MLTGAPSAGRFAPDESTVYVAARKVSPLSVRLSLSLPSCALVSVSVSVSVSVRDDASSCPTLPPSLLA
jgi:hypothetical protein